MNKQQLKLIFAWRAKDIPLWMYYVRALLDILTGIIDIFTLPFGYQLNINVMWCGKMLRYHNKQYKLKHNKS